MNYQAIGRGVYDLAEAEQLTKVPKQRIKRWSVGYDYRYKGELRHTPAIIATTLPHENGTPILDFSDLLEVRFLNAFKEHGVSLKAIRIAAQHAKELLGRHHPFSTRIFKTGGQTILAEVVRETEGETADKHLIDLVKNQYVFREIISPSLYAGFDFNELEEPFRWWPLGKGRRVVLDPQRAFGAPIVVESGVPTRILYNSMKAEQSLEFVADLYEVKRQEVIDAVEFEERLAA